MRHLFYIRSAQFLGPSADSATSPGRLKATPSSFDQQLPLELIYGCEDVKDRPDEKWGEKPCAFVELKSDAQEVNEADIIAFCRDNLAHYKCPRMVIFCDIPKTSTGKIQKFKLRDQFKHDSPQTTRLSGVQIRY